MDIAIVIDAATEAFKQKWRPQGQDLDLERLTPDLAAPLSGRLKQAWSAAGGAGFRPVLHGDEQEAATLAVGGTWYRGPRARPNRFLPPFGPRVRARTRSQRD